MSLAEYVCVPLLTEKDGGLKGGNPSFKWPVMVNFPVIFWLSSDAAMPAADITMMALAPGKDIGIDTCYLLHG